MTLVYVEEKDLQVAQFTAPSEFTQENGENVHLEDGTTKLHLDGTASWTIKVINPPPSGGIILVDGENTASAQILFTTELLAEDGNEILAESGDGILSESLETWTSTLILA